MKREYSKFLPSIVTDEASGRPLSTLEAIGWKWFFAQQLTSDELIKTPPVRVVEVNRSSLHIVGHNIDESILPLPDTTVGDWVLLDLENSNLSRTLERQSLVKRRAPGCDRQIQLIAANVDTAFIVSSCNQEFNIARLERYVALAFDADVSPVIVLTKADLTSSTESYLEEAQTISELVPVVVLDARGDEPTAKLSQWCKFGKTVSFLGSSGVGKSTLTNALLGSQSIETQAIREDDARGRHTTTRRQIHIVPSRCLVLDTPGMRELQLSDAASGINDVFADLSDLANTCKFGDCKHKAEPGCAVLKAIKNGEVNEARFGRWSKLMAEEAFNSASLAQRKTKDKTLSKTISKMQKKNKKRR